ncbi:porphobilinogen deaminase, dipyromethane cofactor binding domain-containing protein [Elsinoe ampelina]|uniref:Porphobilinogen deaminase n=1 Tax=Elsinoe ampelina TaxID=302913 RepID=A0A6A6GCX5_9PEZI|nr:porphobilinogen deaminase, dipyromethane cofactor binding domain-containing protein [Elsinoe ampelina]
MTGAGHTLRNPIRIGTRRSNLALVQAESVKQSLLQLWPDLQFEIEALRTLGDKDQSKELYNFGAKALWTTELEEKLTSGQLDIVVHCLKDMPTNLPDSCELATIPLYDDRRDALIVKAGLPYTSLDTLPHDAVVGTSSVRRSAQLKRLYPHLKFANLRGNVETRLAKVDEPTSDFTCMIMSACGLERIGLQDRINQRMSSEEGGIYHAVGQGALGMEIRKGDMPIKNIVDKLADTRSTLACLAERELRRALEGGCSVPIGVETRWLDEKHENLLLRGIVVSLDGSQAVEESGQRELKSSDDAERLGRDLAAQLTRGGADSILREINAHRPAKAD